MFSITNNGFLNIAEELIPICIQNGYSLTNVFKIIYRSKELDYTSILQLIKDNYYLFQDVTYDKLHDTISKLFCSTYSGITNLHSEILTFNIIYDIKSELITKEEFESYILLLTTNDIEDISDTQEYKKLKSLLVTYLQQRMSNLPSGSEEYELLKKQLRQLIYL